MLSKYFIRASIRHIKLRDALLSAKSVHPLAVQTQKVMRHMESRTHVFDTKLFTALLEYYCLKSILSLFN